MVQPRQTVEIINVSEETKSRELAPKGDEGILRWSQRLKLTFDQRMLDALNLASHTWVEDSDIFAALYRTDSSLNRAYPVDLKAFNFINERAIIRGDIQDHKAGLYPVPLSEAGFSSVSCIEVFKAAAARAIARSRNEASQEKVIGVGDFVSAMIEVAEHPRIIEGFQAHPYTIDVLAYLKNNSLRDIHEHRKGKPGRRNVKWRGAGKPEHARVVLPSLVALKEILTSATTTVEDYQHALLLENGKIKFRVMSIVGDYVADDPTGLRSIRALLAHHNRTFGSFTRDQISELNELINADNTRENDFQEYFDRNPHFFRLWDYREVHPHVFLNRKDDGPLVPDFILTDAELQRAMIVELKLPSAKIVRRKHNRDRFSDAIMDARAQLVKYRDHFEEIGNSDQIRSRLGMSIYRPRLGVIVGRSAEFVNEVDRQRLASGANDIEVVTYDDMLRFAKRRLVQLYGK